jgi:sulfonate transport system substrate-binding protein
VQACLAKYGLKKADVTLKNMGQAEIISAMSSNNADLVGVWAPNTYTLEEKAGAKMFCNGKDGGAIVPGALIARSDYAKENPQAVAKFLAVYLRAQQWALANRKEATAMMKKFYDQGGVTISESAMSKEFDTRPVFNLSGQLKAMNRAGAASEMDGWFGKIGEFMKAAGSVPEAPAPSSFINDSYMKMVDADPKLKAFAGKTN